MSSVLMCVRARITMTSQTMHANRELITVHIISSINIKQVNYCKYFCHWHLYDWSPYSKEAIITTITSTYIYHNIGNSCYQCAATNSSSFSLYLINYKNKTTFWVSLCRLPNSTTAGHGDTYSLTLFLKCIKYLNVTKWHFISIKMIFMNILNLPLHRHQPTVFFLCKTRENANNTNLNIHEKLNNSPKNTFKIYITIYKRIIYKIHFPNLILYYLFKYLKYI